MPVPLDPVPPTLAGPPYVDCLGDVLDAVAGATGATLGPPAGAPPFGAAALLLAGDDRLCHVVLAARAPSGATPDALGRCIRTVLDLAAPTTRWYRVVLVTPRERGATDADVIRFAAIERSFTDAGLDLVDWVLAGARDTWSVGEAADGEQRW